jgi:two-component sensor histidine kinase
MGLIVTELVMNALKHAFPGEQHDGRIIVVDGLAEPNWRLAVSDNGIGKPEGHSDKTNPGLGTTGSARSEGQRWEGRLRSSPNWIKALSARVFSDQRRPGRLFG